MEWFKAFRVFNITPQRYIAQYVAPLVLLGLVISVAAAVFLSGANPFVRWGIVAAAPVFLAYVAYSIPLQHADKTKREIDNNIHLFITHMGVLATANLPPTDIFLKLATKKEYTSLARASDQIASLVRRWNMGLPEACRFVAERTPSTIFSDFLERFAYATETGESLSVFLHNEQGVVMGDYATVYQAALYGVDSVKDMYMSTMMSVIFLAIFGLISPLLTGIAPTEVALFIVGTILLLEIVFLFLLLNKVPYDELWTQLPDKVGLRRDLDAYTPFTVVLGVIAGVMAWWLFTMPMPVAIAIGTTPLLILGFAVSNEEKAIFRRDENYPAFIRSLGASTSARGGAPREVLKKLRRHNFGPLTRDVDSLYRRLNLRLDDQHAWERFAAETGSNIVEKFTAMFVEGIGAGGDAAEIGRLLSENVGKILAVRKHRAQTASSFRGSMMGLTGASAFTLYIGVGMLDGLDDLFRQEDSGTDADQFANVLFSDFTVNMPLLNGLITGALIVHALAVAVMVAKASGGSNYRVAFDFPILVWITALTAVGTDMAFGNLFG